MEAVYQNELRSHHSGTLKENRSPTVVTERLHVEHGRFHETGELRQKPFEARKQRRVIERPWRRTLCEHERRHPSVESGI